MYGTSFIIVEIKYDKVIGVFSLPGGSKNNRC